MAHSAKKDPIHAGYKIQFSEQDINVIHDKIKELLEKQSPEYVNTLMTKMKIRLSREDSETDIDYVIRSLISKQKYEVITAQEYLKSRHFSKEDTQKIQKWYDIATKKNDQDDGSTDNNKIIVKKMYVLFTMGIIAFSGIIKGKPTYFTFGIDSTVSLHKAKLNYNELDRQDKTDLHQYRIDNINMKLDTEPYIVYKN